ncbi:hypothetical protein [Xanthomonas oryzae]|uniref:hypothetical protein n=1 Tax=Xanthomonas oryzae TaxID=347 RepID=UPI002023C54F|nr:hypothetical protein [Xanthomonas oryzae]URJ80959.1 hypothetical protein M9500_14290 [Xanthomonas oryzae pv. oryzae]
MKTGSSSTPKPQVRPCNGCGLGVFQGRLNNNGSRVELSASERLHQFSRFYTDKKEEDLTVFVKEGNWQFDEALDDDLEFDEES